MTDAPAASVGRPRRRSRSWIVAVVVLVVLIVAGVVADAAARAVAAESITAGIRTALGVDQAVPVSVDLGPGSILAQAAAGRLDRVDVAIDSVDLGEVTGRAVLSATGVPLDSSKPMKTLDVRVTLGEDDVRTLSTYLSGVDLTSVRLTDGVIRVGSNLAALFVSVPVTVDLQPAAAPDGISFTPTGIVVAGNPISVDALRSSPEFGDLASSLLASRNVCLAQYLPRSLTVSDAVVVASELVVTLDGDGATLGGADLSTKGVCP